jgi:sugar phosphate isomerase/epimerase
MKLEIFRTLWGYTASKAQALEELLQAGFDGMEARLPLDARERAEFGAFLQANRLGYISTVFTAYDVLPDQSATLAVHLNDLDQKLAWAAELGPRFVNVLAGNDRWSLPQQVEFFGQALDLARKHGQVCSFETHRSRSLFNPWVPWS